MKLEDNKAVFKHLRREFGKCGWALLIYYGIMNVCVALVAVLAVIAAWKDPTGAAAEAVLAELQSNGWGYLAAIFVGAVLMFAWKKREFCLKVLWKTNKPIKIGDFLALTTIFIGIQAVSQLLTPLLDWLCSLAGISLEETIESASASTDTLSMFLYVCIFAPVSEELLFRGLILRSLEPYGRRFSILASSLLFGVFHSNLVQTPYAILAGLVLGYVASEYNVLWAMALHMINNLLLGDVLLRLTDAMSALGQQTVIASVIWGCAIAGGILLFVQRKAVRQWFRQGRMHPTCLKCFFTSPGILLLTALLLGNMLLTLLLQLV